MMATTRERLEAAIRAQLTRAMTRGIQLEYLSTVILEDATRQLLREVDEYATPREAA